jgi:hypothetical protein
VLPIQRNAAGAKETYLDQRARQRVRRGVGLANPVFFLIYLAGVPVHVDLVQHLARQVDGELADKLRLAVTHRIAVVGLEPDERREILLALEEAEEAPLAELRDVLLAEQAFWASAVA